MKQLRVIIVDDEPLARELMQTYLIRMEHITLVASCSNALEAFAILNKEEVDVMLLDINMPQITGIEFLKSLKHPPAVIFTTSYPQYSVESYELNAIDYLLKPISFERLVKAFDKVQQQVLNLPAASTTNNAEKILFVRSEGKWVKLDIQRVWFIEGLKDYIRLWTDEGRITIHATMKSIEVQLASFPNIIRVHKSYFVNLAYVNEIEGNGIKIKDQTIVIGGTYKDEFMRRLGNFKLG